MCAFISVCACLNIRLYVNIAKSNKNSIEKKKPTALLKNKYQKEIEKNHLKTKSRAIK